MSEPPETDLSRGASIPCDTAVSVQSFGTLLPPSSLSTNFTSWSVGASSSLVFVQTVSTPSSRLIILPAATLTPLVHSHGGSASL